MNLVLNDEGLLREVNGACERCRDGVVCGLGLCDEALVALDEDFRGILDRPLADIAEGLTADWGLLGRLGGRPAVRPVIGELLEEWRLDLSGLEGRGSVVSVCSFTRSGRGLALKTGLDSSADALHAAATSKAESVTLRMATKDRDGEREGGEWRRKER